MLSATLAFSGCSHHLFYHQTEIGKGSKRDSRLDLMVPITHFPWTDLLPTTNTKISLFVDSEPVKPGCITSKTTASGPVGSASSQEIVSNSALPGALGMEPQATNTMPCLFSFLLFLIPDSYLTMDKTAPCVDHRSKAHVSPQWAPSSLALLRFREFIPKLGKLQHLGQD